MSDICRICLNNNVDLIEIFEEGNNLAEKIMLIALVKVCISFSFSKCL